MNAQLQRFRDAAHTARMARHGEVVTFRKTQRRAVVSAANYATALEIGGSTTEIAQICRLPLSTPLKSKPKKYELITVRGVEMSIVAMREDFDSGDYVLTLANPETVAAWTE